jgi:hypothetical protein
MSKKPKKKKSGESKVKKHGTRKVVTLRQKVQGVYSSVELSTTCCRQCMCCTVACPQMNQCEATIILDKIWSEWPEIEKKKFIAKCMRHFFSNSLVKPCAMLGRGADGLPGCTIYEDRPLNCRVYGQWSDKSYEERVERFKSVVEVEDRRLLPLNRQCRHVKNVSGSFPTEEQLDALFEELNVIDMVAFGYDRAKIDRKYNRRTIHDWTLARYLGEDRLSVLTTFFLACTKDQGEDYVKKFEELILK